MLQMVHELSYMLSEDSLVYTAPYFYLNLGRPGSSFFHHLGNHYARSLLSNSVHNFAAHDEPLLL